jgi:hypothetical protein
VTVGADEGYDTRGLVQEIRDRKVTPHVSQNTNRSGGSAIDGRMTRHASYQLSQHKRKRIEEVFGPAKDGGNAAQDATSRRSWLDVDLRSRRLQSSGD